MFARQPHRKTGRFPALALIIAVALSAGTVFIIPARTQEVQRIAAVVNDEVVSLFDLVQRLRLVIFSSGLEDSTEVRRRIGPQVLRRLIDERLQLQEARRRNISISENATSKAIEMIERQNNMQPGQLPTYLASKGIDSQTLKVQVEAEIAWLQLLQLQVRTSAVIGEDEIDAELDRIKANAGLPEYRLAEIFLVIESSDQEATVRQNAERLFEQIRAGGNFRVLARQFSDGVTATQGGDLGWVPENQLDSEVAAIVKTMEPGSISSPVRNSGGYLIIQLHDRRVMSVGGSDETTVALKQILLPLAETAREEEIESQVSLAETIRQTIAGCDDMNRAAREIDLQTSGDIGSVKIKDLPPNLRAAVRDATVGEPTAPVRSKRGVHILMVCDREERESTLPDRAAVREALTIKRMETLSRSYLRDLRRDAYIDFRI